MQTVEIPGRLYPLNKVKDEFKNVQLSFVLGITDHAKVNDINKWLNGSGKLILSSDTSKYYNAFVHSAISPERLSVRFGKIPIIFTVEPFRYDVDKRQPTGKDDKGNGGRFVFLRAIVFLPLGRAY